MDGRLSMLDARRPVTRTTQNLQRTKTTQLLNINYFNAVMLSAG